MRLDLRQILGNYFWFSSIRQSAQLLRVIRRWPSQLFCPTFGLIVLSSFQLISTSLLTSNSLKPTELKRAWIGRERERERFIVKTRKFYLPRCIIWLVSWSGKRRSGRRERESGKISKLSDSIPIISTAATTVLSLFQKPYYCGKLGAPEAWETTHRLSQAAINLIGHFLHFLYLTLLTILLLPFAFLTARAVKTTRANGNIGWLVGQFRLLSFHFCPLLLAALSLWARAFV